MDRAFESGINFFDTADVYGGPQRPDIPLGYGISEEIIGEWLQRSGKRDEIVLATKLYQPMIPGPNGGRLSAYHIRKACEDSLRRLKTDHIDLYQMHHFDRLTPWEEIWEAMEVLVRQGKVIYTGSCNFPGWGIAAAQGEARRRNFMGLVSEQSRYSLACRAIELEVLPSARWHGRTAAYWRAHSKKLSRVRVERSLPFPFATRSFTSVLPLTKRSATKRVSRPQMWRRPGCSPIRTSRVRSWDPARSSSLRAPSRGWKSSFRPT